MTGDFTMKIHYNFTMKCITNKWGKVRTNFGMLSGLVIILTIRESPPKKCSFLRIRRSYGQSSNFFELVPLIVRSKAAPVW